MLSPALRYFGAIGAIVTCSRSLICVLRERNELDALVEPLFELELQENLAPPLPRPGQPESLNDGRESCCPIPEEVVLSSSSNELRARPCRSPMPGPLRVDEELLSLSGEFVPLAHALSQSQTGPPTIRLLV